MRSGPRANRGKPSIDPRPPSAGRAADSEATPAGCIVLARVPVLVEGQAACRPGRGWIATQPVPLPNARNAVCFYAGQDTRSIVTDDLNWSI